VRAGLTCQSNSRRGRTNVGLIDATPQALANFIVGFLDGMPDLLRDELSVGENLKLACEDLKSYYLEAATAQPGDADAKQVAEWFWSSTTLAEVFLELKKTLAEHDDETLRLLSSNYFIPRAQAHRLDGNS
jgi:hypothetical protein